ncbi:hypothetical protein DPMN_127308 [Dreissena polymorpha]|uniref:Uncharacterized protein n=1 Tax=Dreissena polymorpha TaxID=45954 RepID=A0A9D4H106_DREPO|nr:hypothetical protein DPMN_127308 [Dreissena polymorpha]
MNFKVQQEEAYCKWSNQQSRPHQILVLKEEENVGHMTPSGSRNIGLKEFPSAPIQPKGKIA